MLNREVPEDDAVMPEARGEITEEVLLRIRVLEEFCFADEEHALADVLVFVPEVAVAAVDAGRDLHQLLGQVIRENFLPSPLADQTGEFGGLDVVCRHGGS